MGCSLSKDLVESPSKGSKGTSSLDKAIHRGFTIQINRSLKVADGGYIAAIFSAYGAIRKHIPFRALDAKSSVRNPSQKEMHRSSTRIMAGNSDSNPHTNFSAHTVLGVPITCTSSASEMLEAQVSTKSTVDNSATIDVLELMDGLDEEEMSANLESWQASQDSSILSIPVHKQGPPTVVSAKTIEKEHISEALSVIKTARRLRPKPFSSFSPIRSIEDVDAALLARKSRTPLASQSWQASQELSILSIPVHEQEPPRVISTKITEKEHISEALSAIKIARRPKSKSFSSFNPIRSIEDVDAALLESRIPLALQSSKPKSYPVMDSIRTSEDVDAALSPRKCKTPSPSKSSREGWKQEEDATILEIDTVAQKSIVDICVPTCKPATGMIDGGNELMPNPENLQRALSFKYMFNHSSSEKPNTISNTSFTTTGEPNPSICRSDSLVFSTAWLLYDGEGNGSPSSPQLFPFNIYPSETDGSIGVGYESSMSESFRSHGVDEPPVFDPEMVDFFENAMRHLSKEEWYAVRGMEESPHNFRRLVKALKKSSSNSSRNQKERRSNLHFSTTMKANNRVGISTKDRLELESKPERLPVEKTRAIIRQNSFDEGRKSFSKTGAQDIMDRDSVVFYSSTVQNGSKAYEDCDKVRSILQCLIGSSYDERSISELKEHEQELRHALNISVLIVPTLYVQGKYLVGIESILHLHKKGRLGFMLKEAVALGSKATMLCSCEGSKRVCRTCEGRHKLSKVGGAEVCRRCGGSGVIKCFSTQSEYGDGT